MVASLLSLPADVLSHLLVMLCVRGLRCVSATCRTLSEHIKACDLFKHSLHLHGMLLTFRAVRYCEDQNVYRFAEENILHGLRPSLLQGTLSCKPQADGSAYLSLDLQNYNEKITHVCPDLSSVCLRKTRVTCFARNATNTPEKLYAYGYYLRLKLGRASFLLATDTDVITINALKEFPMRLHKVHRAMMLLLHGTFTVDVH